MKTLPKLVIETTEPWKAHICDGHEYRYVVDEMEFPFIEVREEGNEKSLGFLDLQEIDDQFNNDWNSVAAFIGELSTLLEKSRKEIEYAML